MSSSTVGPAASTPLAPAPRGRVIFVGSGPGDPDLLTLGAVAALQEASTIILDRPEMRAILDHDMVQLAEGVEIIEMGLRDNGKPLTPSHRARSVLRCAQSGARVVRMVDGDPFMDGGVADEATACVRGGVEFEIVPGVSSLTAVPEYAGVALNNSHGMHFVSATTSFNKSSVSHWASSGTIVINTRAHLVAEIATTAMNSGRAESDPAMVIVHGGSTDQQTLHMTLHDLVDAVEKQGLEADEPVHLMIGPAVAKTDEDLSWYETKPLFGWRVLVPRTKDQAVPMVNRLRSYGAHSEEVPTISVEPPRSPQQMERAIRGLVEGRYEWVAFTSVNAVKAVRERLEQYGLDARAFSGLKVAAVGKTTARALRAWGIEPDLMPSGEQSSAGLAADWPPYDEVLDPINRVLLPRADIATETLSAALVDLGWEVEDVTAYRTVRAVPPPAPIRESIKTGKFDAVVFTSSSTVRNLVGIAGKPHACTVIAAIGPNTVRTCEEHGLRVDVMAAEPSALDLADALASFAAERRDKFLESGDPILRPSQQRRTSRRRR